MTDRNLPFGMVLRICQSRAHTGRSSRFRTFDPEARYCQACTTRISATLVEGLRDRTPKPPPVDDSTIPF